MGLKFQVPARPGTQISSPCQTRDSNFKSLRKPGIRQGRRDSRVPRVRDSTIQATPWSLRPMRLQSAVSPTCCARFLLTRPTLCPLSVYSQSSTTPLLKTKHVHVLTTSSSRSCCSSTSARAKRVRLRSLESRFLCMYHVHIPA